MLRNEHFAAGLVMAAISAHVFATDVRPAGSGDDFGRFSFFAPEFAVFAPEFGAVRFDDAGFGGDRFGFETFDFGRFAAHRAFGFAHDPRFFAAELFFGEEHHGAVFADPHFA